MRHKENKKKIAFVSTLRSVPWGGSEELWNLSAHFALEQNNEVGVFVYDWNKLHPKLEELKEKGAYIYKRPKTFSLFKRLLVKFTNNSIFLNPYKDLIKFSPDIIVITDGSTYFTANDKWLSKILLEYFEYKYIIICQGNTPYHLPKNRLKALSLFEKAKKIAFVANRNREECYHQLGKHLDNTEVIQNPINLKKIELLPLPQTNDNTIHLALVGRLKIADKGQDLLIALMAEPFWKNANVFIHIYGAGDDKAYLEHLIKYYQVEDKVFLEGISDPITIFKRCHALVMPSIIEGTSLALLEAMSLGRVCIVTDVGGSAEWIIDGENGYLIEAPTKLLIDRKLKIAINNFNCWSIMGEKAHQHLLKHVDLTPGQTLYRSF